MLEKEDFISKCTLNTYSFIPIEVTSKFSSPLLIYYTYDRSPSSADKVDKVQMKRLRKTKVPGKSRHQTYSDIVYGRNLDPHLPHHQPAMPPHSQVQAQHLPMEHDWRFVIPNIRENANIFIGMYARAHDNFSHVVSELNGLSRSNSEEGPETHDIEIIE